jgi:hypothetical protein
VLGQEAARVGRDALAHVRVFERDIGVAGESGARQRRLARLPRPRQHDHRKAAREAQHAGTGVAVEH